VALFTVGVDTCKALIHSRLKITEHGTGYVHLPLPHQTKDGEYRAGVDEEFIAQLTSEKLVTKHKGGVPHRVWVQTRPRNEALDMLVYSVSALRLLRPDLTAMAARLSPQPPKPPAPPAPERNTWITARKPGGWLKGRR
jgi:phage terminase large subunit GpA-like protein